MEFESSHGGVRLRATGRRRGRLLFELLIVKLVSLAFGIGVTFAIDPSISRMDGDLLTAVQTDAAARCDAVMGSAGPEFETVSGRSPRRSSAPRAGAEAMTRSMGDLIDGPAVTLVVP